MDREAVISRLQSVIQSKSQPVETAPVEVVQDVPLIPELPALCNDPSRQVADVRLITRAVSEGWIVAEEILQKLPVSMANMALDVNNDPEIRLAATNTVIAMVNSNQKNKPSVQRVKHSHKVVGVSIEPVTEENLAERKRVLADRLAQLRDDAGGSGAG